jgi:Rad3-related DNA helicase
MSFSPQPLLNFFPTGVTPRPAQLDVLDFIERSVLAGERNIIIQAPTGVGKSYIAKAVCDWASSSYICTSTKQLQDQYLSDFRSLTTVKGRSNFQCLHCADSSFSSCDEGTCTYKVEYKCPFGLTTDITDRFAAESASKGSLYWRTSEHCCYYENKVDGMNADTTVQNYTYMLYEHFGPRDFFSRSVIIFDECHNIEKELLNFLCLNLSSKSIALVNSFLSELNSAPIEFVAFKTVKGSDGNIATNSNKNSYWIDFLNGLQEQLQAILSRSANSEDRKKDYKQIQSLFIKVQTVLTLSQDSVDNWAIDEREDCTHNLLSVLFKPVIVCSYVEKCLCRMGDVRIFMSATILDPAYYAETLGLSSYVYKEIPPVFTPAQNKLYSLRFADFSYSKLKQLNASEKENFFKQVVQKIDSILEQHINEKGLIHCGTYELQDYIRTYSKYSTRLIFPNAVDKVYMLAAHKTLSNSVVCSPSITEGVDFKNDLSRFQVIVKLPYLDLSDLQIKERMKIDPDFYPYNTAKTLIQELGRSVRNENDWCVSYILDSRFDNFCATHPALTKLITRHLCKKAALPTSLKVVRRRHFVSKKGLNKASKFVCS